MIEVFGALVLQPWLIGLQEKIWLEEEVMGLTSKDIFMHGILII